MSYSKRQIEKQTYKNNRDSSSSAIGGEKYAPFPYEFNKQAIISLDGSDIKILNALIHKLRCKRVKGQYITNNGDLSITHKMLKEEFNVSMSKSTLSNSLKRMIDKGFIIKTRQGGKNMCSLYALTYMKIGDIKGADGKRKIDYPPTEAPSNDWRAIAIRDGLYKPSNNDDSY